MALIKCAECGKEISDSAEICPNCGCKTAKGQQTAKAKGLLTNYLLQLVLLIVGAIIFFPAFLTAMENIGSSWYWKYDDDSTIVLFRLAVGAGMLIGSAIDFIRLANTAKELNQGPSEDEEEKSTAFDISDIEYIPIDAIPSGKRKQGMCQMCHKSGSIALCKIPKLTYEYELCLNCINKYKANIQ